MRSSCTGRGDWTQPGWIVKKNIFADITLIILDGEIRALILDMFLLVGCTHCKIQETSSELSSLI